MITAIRPSNQESARVNGFLRQHLAAIDCKPTERGGRRFYRAVVTASEAEMIKEAWAWRRSLDK